MSNQLCVHIRITKVLIYYGLKIDDKFSSVELTVFYCNISLTDQLCAMMSAGRVGTRLFNPALCSVLTEICGPSVLFSSVASFVSALVPPEP